VLLTAKKKKRALVLLSAMFCALASSVVVSVSAVYPDTIFDYDDIDDIVGDLALPITKKLCINCPESSSASSPASSYFISGTANPKKKLYMNGVEVKNRAKNGCFGVFVENLASGKNVFVFRQGKVEKTVNLYYGVAVPASKVIKNEEAEVNGDPSVLKNQGAGKSAWPSADVLVREKEINVSCTAPAGADVTAEVAGEKVDLVGNGNSFSATVDVSDYIGSRRRRSLGNVKYKIVSGEKVEEIKSVGRVLYADPSVEKVVARVKSVLGSVLKDHPGDYDLLARLKAGSEFVVDVSPSGYSSDGDVMPAGARYTKLASGGYIRSEDVELLSGKPKEGKCTGFSFKVGTKTEKLVIKSNRKSAFLAKLDLENGEFKITFENTQSKTNVGDGLLRKSKLVESLKITNDEGGKTSTFLFKLKNVKNFWGFNVEYTKNNEIVIFFKKKPKLTGGERPFENLTITLDPGHGANDPGAVETPDVHKEKHINLATAKVVRNRLEAMGAKVIMTRDDKDEEIDGKVSWDTRFAESEKKKPDFYISLHANSSSPDKDYNKVNGLEVYYHFPQSRAFAELLGENTTKYGKKKLRKVESATYGIVLSTYSPAVLLEMGFLPCPKEYEKMCSKSGMFDIANAIADSIYTFLE
jgi:N-acetylmuramoyl-L-alanine amidase